MMGRGLLDRRCGKRKLVGSFCVKSPGLLASEPRGIMGEAVLVAAGLGIGSIWPMTWHGVHSDMDITVWIYYLSPLERSTLVVELSAIQIRAFP
jgi:hypothetical protein